MAWVDIQPGYFAKIANELWRHGPLRALFYAVGLVLMLVAVIIVGIIISDVIYYLFYLFAA